MVVCARGPIDRRARLGHPVAVYRWFTLPNSDLVPEDLNRELSPREWLVAGYSPKLVAELAADLTRCSGTPFGPSVP